MISDSVPFNFQDPGEDYPIHRNCPPNRGRECWPLHRSGSATSVRGLCRWVVERARGPHFPISQEVLSYGKAVSMSSPFRGLPSQAFSIGIAPKCPNVNGLAFDSEGSLTHVH